MESSEKTTYQRLRKRDDTVAKVSSLEAAAIEYRRRRMFPDREEYKDKEAVDEHVSHEVVDAAGLTLSGGGVRSASFNLGLLQAFVKCGLVRWVDYLSTVSGGGFVGTYLSTLLCHTQTPKLDENLPLVPKKGGGEPAPVEQFLLGGKYLKDAPMLLDRFLIGFLLNVLLWGSLLVFLTATIAFVWRSLDCPQWVLIVRDTFPGPGYFYRDWSRPFIIPAILFTLWFLSWPLTFFRNYRPRFDAPRPHGKKLLIWAMLTTVMGVAVLLATDDIQLTGLVANGNFVRDRLEGHRIVGYLLLVVLLLNILPYLNPVKLFRSEFRPPGKVEGAVLRFSGATLLIVLPFALIYVFAREGISNYHRERPPTFVAVDIPRPFEFLDRLRKEAHDYVDSATVVHSSAAAGQGISPEEQPDSEGSAVESEQIVTSTVASPWLSREITDKVVANLFKTDFDLDTHGHILNGYDTIWSRVQDGGIDDALKDSMEYYDGLEELLVEREFLNAFLSTYQRKCLSDDGESENDKISQYALLEFLEDSHENPEKILVGYRKDKTHVDDFMRKLEKAIDEGSAKTLERKKEGQDGLPTSRVPSGKLEQAVNKQLVFLKCPDLDSVFRVFPDARFHSFVQLGLGAEEACKNRIADGKVNYSTVDFVRKTCGAFLAVLLNEQVLRQPRAIKELVAAVEGVKTTPDGDVATARTLTLFFEKAGKLREGKDFVNSDWPDAVLAHGVLSEKDRTRVNRRILETLYDHHLEERMKVGSALCWGADQGVRFKWAAVALLLFLVLGPTIDINSTSLHGFFRKKLEDAYVVRGTNGKLLKDLQTTEKGGPYHFICATVNFFDDWPWRTTEYSSAYTFYFSRFYCGSQALPGDPAETDKYCGGEVDVATAAAISGAAFSPAILRNPLLFCMTMLLNLRLGQWLPNPSKQMAMKSVHRVTAFGVLRDFFKTLRADKDEKRSENWNYCFLSDGGHNDNLALSPVLFRQNRLVFVSDATQDPNFDFPDFIKAHRRYRFRGGMRFRKLDGWKDLRETNRKCIDLDPLRPRKIDQSRIRVKASGDADSESGETRDVDDRTARRIPNQSPRHFVLSKLTYPPANPSDPNAASPPPSIIVYIKSTMTGDEEADLRQYHFDNPQFPHDPTTDQFFTENQVESYRQLGYHVGHGVCDVVLQGKRQLGLSPMNEGETASTNSIEDDLWDDACKCDEACQYSVDDIVTMLLLGYFGGELPVDDPEYLLKLLKLSKNVGLSFDLLSILARHSLDHEQEDAAKNALIRHVRDTATHEAFREQLRSETENAVSVLVRGGTRPINLILFIESKLRRAMNAKALPQGENPVQDEAYQVVEQTRNLASRAVQDIYRQACQSFHGLANAASGELFKFLLRVLQEVKGLKACTKFFGELNNCEASFKELEAESARDLRRKLRVELQRNQEEKLGDDCEKEFEAELAKRVRDQLREASPKERLVNAVYKRLVDTYQGDDGPATVEASLDELTNMEIRRASDVRSEAKAEDEETVTWTLATLLLQRLETDTRIPGKLRKLAAQKLSEIREAEMPSASPYEEDVRQIIREYFKILTQGSKTPGRDVLLYTLGKVNLVVQELTGLPAKVAFVSPTGEREGRKEFLRYSFYLPRVDENLGIDENTVARRVLSEGRAIYIDDIAFTDFHEPLIEAGENLTVAVVPCFLEEVDKAKAEGVLQVICGQVIDDPRLAERLQEELRQLARVCAYANRLREQLEQSTQTIG